jgi:hypothetical protein
MVYSTASVRGEEGLPLDRMPGVHLAFPPQAFPSLSNVQPVLSSSCAC